MLMLDRNVSYYFKQVESLNGLSEGQLIFNVYYRWKINDDIICVTNIWYCFPFHFKMLFLVPSSYEGGS